MTIQEYIAKEQKMKAAFQLPKAFQLAASQANMLNAFANPMSNHPINRFIIQESQLKRHFQIFSKLDSFSRLDAAMNTMTAFNKSLLFFRTFDLNIESDEDEIPQLTIDESVRVKRIITDIYKDELTLLKLQPREFEEVIAELLASQGFKVELTKQTRDNGYDIIALKYLDNHSPLKFLVECKRFVKGKVGIEIIRGFKEVVMNEHANKGIIVTTSYFTKDAIKKQKETPYLLDYRDKDAVMDWVYSYQQR